MSIKPASYPTHVTPDTALIDCEQTLESLGRLERMVIRLKEKACRGDEHAERVLVGLRDDVYTLLATAMLEEKS